MVDIEAASVDELWEIATEGPSVYGGTFAWAAAMELLHQNRLSWGLHRRELAEKAVAQMLVDYMNFRAATEGRAHSLDVPYYMDYLVNGCEEFFGITVDVDERKLIRDDQNPSAFALWLASLRAEAA